jgi:hypothetical protein
VPDITSFTGVNRFLSNFYSVNISYMGVIWPTVEHAFQASKSLDTSIQETIRLAENPTKAKQLGSPRGIVVLRSDWDHVRDQIMYEIVKAKFDQSDDLKLKLLMTKDKTLVEGNFWHDNYWGDCFCKNPKFKCQDTQGLNKLGLILTRIRQEYRQENP